MRIDADNDPNEAYEIRPTPIIPNGPPTTWWAIYVNGVYRFSKPDKTFVQRYATDPAFRLEKQQELEASRRVGNQTPTSS
jgi:hypothetical protein